MPRTIADVAIAQDWLAAEAGSEWVTLELSRLLADADIHTTFFEPGIFGRAFLPERVRTWPLQRIPGAATRFRSFLPFYPIWFSLLDLRHYELVISSSVAFAHAVRTGPNALHVSYVHTPLRYAWDLDTYLAGSSAGFPARLGARLLQPALRSWDRATSARPDIIVANSMTVRERIRRFWDRDAEVIHPPVDVESIPMAVKNDGFLLVAARLLAYRRVDIAIEAAAQLNCELVVVGDGPERHRLDSFAGPHTRFMGRVDRPTLIDLFSRCRAYVVPGVEDFGIAPVEAMAAGKPVVALRAGGARETVLDGETGVLYDKPEVAALCAAIERLDSIAIDPVACRRRAATFGRDRFRSRWRDLLLGSGVRSALLDDANA
jgi:glycosyltransferase involved in cell wall biosynthesis